MNKKLILLFCMILLVGTISALEFDNVKSYDELTKTVTIENVFGLGADIAKIKLNTPLVVTTGYGGEFKVAEFEVTSLTDYTDAFGDMKFSNVNDNLKEIEREIKYKVRSYEDYEVDDYADETIIPFFRAISDYICYKIETRRKNIGLSDKYYQSFLIKLQRASSMYKSPARSYTTYYKNINHTGSSKIYETND